MRVEPEGMSRREALRITAVAGLAIAFGGTLSTGVLRRMGLHRVGATRTGLGTVIQITVIHPDREAARSMVEGAFHELTRLEGILSRHREGTPLARLNRNGVIEDPPPELLDVMRSAAGFSALTSGAFDPTIAPLLDLYRTRFRESGSRPAPAEVADALSLVDHRRVLVEDSEIRFERPGMSVTLDGIAKGYVVDRTAEALAGAGAERVMVEAGGDLSALGAAENGGPWTVGIRSPSGEDGTAFLGVLELSGQGAATSGDYLQSFTQDRSLHHILDPRTGVSPEHTSAVTVIAPTAMEADALSTGSLVLGPSDGLALLDRWEGAEGLFVTKEGTEYATPGFSRHAS